MIIHKVNCYFHVCANGGCVYKYNKEITHVCTLDIYYLKIFIAQMEQRSGILLVFFRSEVLIFG